MAFRPNCRSETIVRCYLDSRRVPASDQNPPSRAWSTAKVASSVGIPEDRVEGDTRMRRILDTCAMLLLLTIFASTTARTTAAKERHFVSANMRLAGKIPYPRSRVDAGFVTLSVNLDETGKLTSVDILQDLLSVSRLAIAAVRSWTYSAATLDGKPVASTFTINILFDPGFLGADNIPLQPPSQVSAISKKDPAYFPAQPNTVTFAPYPASTRCRARWY